jgi:hypothetical protein
MAVNKRHLPDIIIFFLERKTFSAFGGGLVEDAAPARTFLKTKKPKVLDKAAPKGNPGFASRENIFNLN